jgi:16S rRNA G527 N7-methylase RsmG
VNNKLALDFFRKMSEDKLKGQKSVKLANSSDFSDLDAAFILKYTNDKSNILDLGSGTGLIINKICNKIGKITAIESFKNFTDFIIKRENIQIINQNIFDYNPSIDDQFDLITIFAVMHYFNENESIEIYNKYFPFLKPGGKLICKNQFGIKEDVVVEGYSDEQKTNYYAEYRHIDKEVKLFEKIGYKNIEVIDIYPPECNRWNNTHFYAIVATK